MTDHQSVLAKIHAACWKDETFKVRFMNDPKAVLAEHGIDVPDRIEVTVVENTDDRVHITLPKAPSDHGDLSDEELEAAAGGASMAVQTMQYQRRLVDPDASNGLPW